MKISELFFELQNKIFIKSLSNAVYLGCPYPPMTMEFRAWKTECKLSLQNLSTLIMLHSDEEVSAQSLQVFIDFLAQRWKRVRQTNLTYTHSPNSDLTKILLELVSLIAPILNVNKFKLLMPTLDVSNEILGRDLGEEDEPQGLQHFVLSDDDVRPINVFDCLEYTKEDLIFKHTHVMTQGRSNRLDDRVLKRLSETEKLRVLEHSMVSKKYFKRIEALHQVKVNGGSMGAHTRRLIECLRKGGQNGGRDGTADIAGKDASAGIKEFYHFTKILNEEEIKYWNACFITDANIAATFELCWAHLLSRTVAEGSIDIPDNEMNNMLELLHINSMRMSTTPCVELISNDLEKILYLHHELYTMYPKNKNGGSEIALSFCEKEVAEVELELKKKLEEDHFQPQVSYSIENDTRIAKEVFKSVATNALELKRLVNEFPNYKREHLLTHILGVEFIHQIVTTARDLINLIRGIHPVELQSLIFNLLGNNYLRVLIADVKDLKDVLFELPYPSYENFFKSYLGESHLKNIIKTQADVQTLVQGMSMETRRAVNTHLGLIIPAIEENTPSTLSFFRRRPKRKYDDSDEEDEVPEAKFQKRS